jgi:hypothetical protein
MAIATAATSDFEKSNFMAAFYPGSGRATRR